MTSALLSFPGAESASTTTWVVLSKDACAFVKLQDVARRAFALKKKTAPKLQALARGVAARNVVWRQKCSELKLRDRVTYAAASAGGSFSRLWKARFSGSTIADNASSCCPPAPGDEVKRQSIRSLSLLPQWRRRQRRMGTRKATVHYGVAALRRGRGKLHAPTAKVQALLRKRKVLFDVLPLAKQSAYRMFKERREKQLKALKAEQQKRAAADVSKLFSCILPAEVRERELRNAVSMMSSGSSGGALDSPRQDAPRTCGPSSSPWWGSSPPRRGFAASRPEPPPLCGWGALPMRHVIVEGVSGRGRRCRRTDREGGARHGLAPSSAITDVRKDSNGLVTGAVNRINLDSTTFHPAGSTRWFEGLKNPPRRLVTLLSWSSPESRGRPWSSKAARSPSASGSRTSSSSSRSRTRSSPCASCSK